MNEEIKFSWDYDIEDKFRRIIDKTPEMMREFARKKVLKRLSVIIDDSGREIITEKDMVDAFFAVTPFGFHGPLKFDMESLGIDFVKYGYPK